MQYKLRIENTHTHPRTHIKQHRIRSHLYLILMRREIQTLYILNIRIYIYRDQTTTKI